MKKVAISLVALLLVVALAVAAWFVWGRGNRDALWHTVSQQCVPNQQQQGTPTPCLKVDLQQRYVLFKDRKGPLHDLVMPTKRISGIESTLLQAPGAPPLFALAWANRGSLAAQAGQPIGDDMLALAVNSRYGRSQDLLHIHLACLRPEVYQSLRQQAGRIGNSWQPLTSDLRGHLYLARKLNGLDLVQENPFKLLEDYAQQRGDDLANYGLALAMIDASHMVLLATRVNVFRLNLGSAGELQDYDCALRQSTGR